MRLVLAVGVLLLSAGCGALAGSLGLAAAGDVATGLSTLQAYATAKVDETASKAQLYAAGAAALGAASAMAARWVDHKLRGRGSK